MLQSMHERLQGIVAGAIVFLICVTFALWGVQNYLHGSNAAKVVAKVNGSEITQDQLQVAYQRTRSQLMMAHKNYPSDQKSQANLKKDVLKQMINDKLMSQHADDLDFFVGYSELNGILMGMPAFQENGMFSVARFEQILNNMMYSETEFLNQLRDTVMLNQLTAGVTGSSFALNNEVDNAVRLGNQKRDIGYVMIPWQNFMSKVTVSKGQVAKYYKEHQDEFMTKESVSVQYLQLLASDIVKKVGVANDKILRQYYQNNIDIYSVPKKWQFIKLTINAADSLAPKELKAAKQGLVKASKSVTSSSAKSLMAPLSGEVVTMTSAEMGPTVTQMLKKLTKGQVSPIFKTRQGLTVIKLLKVIPSKPFDYTKIKGRILKAWQKQKAMEEFADQSSKLADLTYTNSDSLKVASKQLNLPIQVTKEFGTKGGKSDITANARFLKVAFSDLVLKQNYNSNPIEISAGNVVVLRVNKYHPSVAKPLQEVAATIKAKLQQQTAQAKASEVADEVFAAIKNGGDYSSLIKKFPGLRWQTLSGLTRAMYLSKKPNVDKNSLHAKLAAFAFDLPMPSVTNKPAKIEKLPNGDRVVVVSLKATMGDSSAPHKDLFKKFLGQTFGQYEYNLLLQSWLHQAKVKILDKTLR